MVSSAHVGQQFSSQAACKHPWGGMEHISSSGFRESYFCHTCKNAVTHDFQNPSPHGPARLKEPKVDTHPWVRSPWGYDPDPPKTAWRDPWVPIESRYHGDE